VNLNQNRITEECNKRCIKENIVENGINDGFKTIKIDCTDRTYQHVKYIVEKLDLFPNILDKYVQKDYWSTKDNILTSYT
jgi:hypothetical protein